MEAFVKSIKTWETLAYGFPVKWTDLPVMSNENNTGDMIFPFDERLLGMEGNWLVMGDDLWVIKAIKASEREGTLTYTLQDRFNAFYRSHIMFYSQTTVGGFLATAFTNSYKNQSDAEYAMPYLRITNSDSTPLIVPPLENGVLFNMANYLRSVSQQGVKISIQPAAIGQGVDVDISTRSADRETVEFESGHSQLVSCETTVDTVSKITAVINGANHFYYLQPDGTIAQTAPSPRIKGTWQTVCLSPEEDVEANLKALFAKNSASKKIEFYSDKLMECGTPVRIATNRQIIEAELSYVAISSGDGRYHYKAGDLPVTLTDKLRIAMQK